MRIVIRVMSFFRLNGIYFSAVLVLGACMKGPTKPLTDADVGMQRTVNLATTDSCGNYLWAKAKMTTTTPYVMPDSSGQIPPNAPIRMQMSAECQGAPLSITGARLMVVTPQQRWRKVASAGGSADGVMGMETNFAAVADSLVENQGSYRVHFRVEFDYTLRLSNSSYSKTSSASDDFAITVGPCNDYEGSQAIFAKDVFRDLMGRDAEASQVLAMSQALNYYRTTRAEIILGLLRSYERGSREINGIYMTYLNRPAEPAVLDLGNPSSTISVYLKGGVSVESIRAGVLGSEEFFRNQAKGDNATFVKQIYFLTLGRYPSLANGDGELMLYQLQTGKISRTEAARSLLLSREWGVLRANQWLAKISGFYRVQDSYREKVITDFMTVGRDQALVSFLSSGYYRTLPWCQTGYF